MTTTYKARKEAGLCTRCGGEIEDERKGKILCKACQEWATVYNRERSKLFSELGRCITCGKPIEPERQGKTRCTRCAKRDTENSARRRLLIKQKQF